MNYKRMLREYVTLMSIRNSGFNLETHELGKLLKESNKIEAYNGPHILSQYENQITSEIGDLKNVNKSLLRKIKNDRDTIDSIRNRLESLIEEFRAEKNYSVSDRIRSIKQELDNR